MYESYETVYVFSLLYSFLVNYSLLLVAEFVCFVLLQFVFY